LILLRCLALLSCPFCWQAKSSDYISKIAWLAGIPLEQLLLDNTNVVVDLDAPLSGATLLLCNPAQGQQGYWESISSVKNMTVI